MTWEEAIASAEAIRAGRPDEYASATIDNMAALVAALRRLNLPAPMVAPGYWPTFQLVWEEASIEIEVFANVFEFYITDTVPLDVIEFPCSAQEPVPASLLERTERALRAKP